MIFESFTSSVPKKYFFFFWLHNTISKIAFFEIFLRGQIVFWTSARAKQLSQIQNQCAGHFEVKLGLFKTGYVGVGFCVIGVLLYVAVYSSNPRRKLLWAQFWEGKLQWSHNEKSGFFIFVCFHISLFFVVFCVLCSLFSSCVLIFVCKTRKIIFCCTTFFPQIINEHNFCYYWSIIYIYWTSLPHEFLPTGSADIKAHKLLL